MSGLEGRLLAPADELTRDPGGTTGQTSCWYWGQRSALAGTSGLGLGAGDDVITVGGDSEVGVVFV